MKSNTRKHYWDKIKNHASEVNDYFVIIVINSILWTKCHCKTIKTHNLREKIEFKAHRKRNVCSLPVNKVKWTSAVYTQLNSGSTLKIFLCVTSNRELYAGRRMISLTLTLRRCRNREWLGECSPLRQTFSRLATQ